jgi:hypothetical protein
MISKCKLPKEAAHLSLSYSQKGQVTFPNLLQTPLASLRHLSRVRESESLERVPVSVIVAVVMTMFELSPLYVVLPFRLEPL